MSTARIRRIALPLAATLLLGACAGTPTAPPGVPPPHAVAQAIDTHVDRPVRWGGMVIETGNFERHSEIEVLAFPLDRHGRPQPAARDLGRLVVLRAGFLDPQVFAPGRFVTVDGRVTGDRRGRFGEASYVWPEVDAADIELWPVDFRRAPPRVSFGIGIGIRR
jgi:outer membrane lipoprotein